jgi:hypothetical protein
MRADRSLRRPVSPLLFVFALLLTAAGFGRADPPAGYLDVLLQEARSKRLPEQRMWQLLLHHHYDIFGRYRSEIDDPAFFLSPRGRKDPSAELDATLKAFFDPVPADPEAQHPQCRFPARYSWLKEQLGFDARLPEQPCPRYEKWRSQMNPGSIAIVFASYYLNNPASMYGHTFLRLNAKGRSEKERLLDYTVNFAAELNTTNGILFAVKGLTGGYRGRFSTMPYYMKVQEYNNLESRDLWEYELALTPEEIDRLAGHLWELGPASMAYYFLNKNCSYQLLPLIEVARPSLRLVDSFWFKAIPVDTLRSVIDQPGFLGNVRRRPSHLSKMLAARAELAPAEVRAASRLAKRTDDASLQTLRTFPEDRQAKVLDSAFDLFRYRAGFKRDQPEQVREQERALLLARNRLVLMSSPAVSGRGSMDSPPTAAGNDGGDPPESGHPTGRAAVSFGAGSHSSFEEVSLRSAIHDLDDNAGGYIPGSELEMFHLRLRYDNRSETAYIQEFKLINILSLAPWDTWVRKPSWNVNTGLSVARDLDHDPEDSLYYGLQVGSGLSYRPAFFSRALVYGLGQADVGLGQVFEDDYRLGGGINSGVLLDAASWWRIHFNAVYLRYPLGERGEAVKLRLVQAVPLGKRMQARVILERQNAYKEIVFSFLLYL